MALRPKTYSYLLDDLIELHRIIMEQALENYVKQSR